MRITLVISAVTAGGAERVMSGMANYWVAHEHDITLLTLWPAALDWYSLDPRVTRVALSASRISPSANTSHALRSNFLRILQLRHEIKKSRPHAVISFGETTNVLTLLASLGLGSPVIISERVNPIMHPVGLPWRILRSLSYRYADALVIQSSALQEWAAKVTRTKRIHVIPNPVKPIPASFDYISNVEVSCHKLVAMGRLVEQKGFDLLLKAFGQCASKYPGWSLIILGEGQERKRLQALAANLGIENRVHLAGMIREPASILKRADLFVMSSRYEGFPNALLEAMACGVAVISTDCPTGPRDIVRDGVDGLLVPPNDVGALAAAMDCLMANESKRQSLGAKALEVRGRFSFETIMGQWESLLSQASGAQHHL